MNRLAAVATAVHLRLAAPSVVPLSFSFLVRGLLTRVTAICHILSLLLAGVNRAAVLLGMRGVSLSGRLGHEAALTD